MIEPVKHRVHTASWWHQPMVHPPNITQSGTVGVKHMGTHQLVDFPIGTGWWIPMLKSSWFSHLISPVFRRARRTEPPSGSSSSFCEARGARPRLWPLPRAESKAAPDWRSGFPGDRRVPRKWPEHLFPAYPTSPRCVRVRLLTWKTRAGGPVPAGGSGSCARQ